MEDIKLLKTSVQLGALYAKVSLSLDEIKKNHPNREDLITSMSKSLQDIQEIHECFKELEEDYRTTVKALFRLQYVNLDLKNKFQDLQNEIKFKDIDL